MIIFDFNQIMLSNIIISMKGHNIIDVSMIRHMALNSIRAHLKKFKKDFGPEIVIATDHSSWRKEFFPFYKAYRSDNREADSLDWNLIYECMNTVRGELKNEFPYNVINIYGAEADDIIGTLVHEFGMDISEDRILIISSDKDFIQLHTYGNVSQYSPIEKKFIKHSNPDSYLFEHICKGDRGDGIPNVYSPDNSFVDKIRQSPVTKKKLQTLLDNEDNALPEVKRNLSRNRTLIDLTRTPKKLKEKILTRYRENKNTIEGKEFSSNELVDYFMKNRLVQHMRNLKDFI